MVFSQNFPDYFDGIVAGDPVYDLEAIALTEDWGVQAIEAITPTPIEKLPNGSPVLYPALPVADQNLFTSAILAACDRLDGTADGVVDNLPACWAKFDPATFVFPRDRASAAMHRREDGRLSQCGADRCRQEDQSGTAELPRAAHQGAGQHGGARPCRQYGVRLSL